jgi:hypothetical protein
MRTDKFFSVTTSKHINKWINKNGNTGSTITTVDHSTIEGRVDEAR